MFVSIPAKYLPETNNATTEDKFIILIQAKSSPESNTVTAEDKSTKLMAEDDALNNEKTKLTFPIIFIGGRYIGIV
ncbi:hypothetical protein Hanom_Chr17g01579581 [Helianthus anomalus]